MMNTTTSYKISSYLAFILVLCALLAQPVADYYSVDQDTVSYELSDLDPCDDSDSEETEKTQEKEQINPEQTLLTFAKLNIEQKQINYFPEPETLLLSLEIFIPPPESLIFS